MFYLNPRKCVDLLIGHVANCIIRERAFVFPFVHAYYLCKQQISEHRLLPLIALCGKWALLLPPGNSISGNIPFFFTNGTGYYHLL